MKFIINTYEYLQSKPDNIKDFIAHLNGTLYRDIISQRYQQYMQAELVRKDIDNIIILRDFWAACSVRYVDYVELNATEYNALMALPF